MRSEITSGIDDCIYEICLVEEGNAEETQDSLLMNRTKSLFQILYYHITKGKNRTPLHVMNAIYLYQLQSNERTDKRSRKYMVFQSSERHVPLPSHFDKNRFTLGGNG